MVGAVLKGALSPREIQGELPLAQGEHYKHLFWQTKGRDCVWADPRAEAEDLAELDAIAGVVQP